jgi:hypothetical protein
MSFRQIFPVNDEIDTGNQGVSAMVARRRARLAEQLRVAANADITGEA